MSVVIPVRNGEPHLRSCLESVLAQTYEHLEVIVADNSSDDQTSAILDGFTDPRIRRLAVPAQMLPLHDNWERVIAAGTGEFIKIVCHDDLLLPDCVRSQTFLLLEHPGAALVSNRRRIIDDRGSVVFRARGLGRKLTGPNGTQVHSAAQIAHACVRAGTNLLGEPAGVLIRRAALPTPLLDARWRYALDLEFYMRCLRHGEAVVNETIQACFRVSPRQLSAELAHSQADELERFFAELQTEYPDDITNADLRIAAIKSRIQARARNLLYRHMRRRAAAAS